MVLYNQITPIDVNAFFIFRNHIGYSARDDQIVGVDYTDEMAYDYDHLSIEGAKQLTRRVDSLLKTLE